MYSKHLTVIHKWYGNLELVLIHCYNLYILSLLKITLLFDIKMKTYGYCDFWRTLAYSYGASVLQTRLLLL